MAVCTGGRVARVTRSIGKIGGGSGYGCKEQGYELTFGTLGREGSGESTNKQMVRASGGEGRCRIQRTQGNSDRMGSRAMGEWGRGLAGE